MGRGSAFRLFSQTIEFLKKAQEEGDGDVPLPDDFEVRGHLRLDSTNTTVCSRVA